MFLTQSGGLILGPISKLMGLIMNLFYEIFSKFGVESIGLSIIFFTVFVRLLLLPGQIGQGKSSRITNYIQPEMKKIAKKYRNKRDQESTFAMQRETKELQDQYGISMSSSCISILIQMPILFSLIKVVNNIPAYVSKIKELYQPIANAIASSSNGTEDGYEMLRGFVENSGNASLKIVELKDGNVDTIIDVLAKVPSNMWDSFKETFSACPDVINSLNANLGDIQGVNSFWGGIDLTMAPGIGLTAAFLIPLLTLIFQFLSMRATPQQESDDPTQQASMKMMKGMSYVFPLISFFTVINIQAGVGLYWLSGTILSFISSMLIRLYFNKCDVEKLVEKSKKKAAKKIAKKKAKGKKSFMEKLQEAAYGQQPAGNSQSQGGKVNNGVANRSLKNYDSNAINKNNGNTQYRAGSLAAKANALQRYNDNNGGK